MHIIGITGGIGTGKSTVLHILEAHYQAYIIEADRIAHELMLPGHTAYNRIIDTFRPYDAENTLIAEDGTINRVTLSKIVFHDETLLEQLNSIVHPEVKLAIQAMIAKQQALNTKLLVIEAALLIEDGYQDICDEIWYIYSSQEIRIRRLMEGRGYTYDRCIDVMKNQASDEFYRSNCKHTIDNSFDEHHTQDQLEELLKQL